MLKKIISAALLIFCFNSCAYHVSPFPVVKLAPEAASLMKGDPRYWLEVQVPQRRIVLAKGAHVIKTFPIAVGMPDYPSPTGWRKLSRVIWNPWWYPPKTSKWVEDATPVAPRTKENPLGEIKMPIGKDAYLIHGTKARQSIGSWASHGCIRMVFEDVFGLVQLLLTEYSDVSAVEEMQKANKDTNKEFATILKRDVPVYLSYDPVKVVDGQLSLAPDVYQKIPDYMQRVREVTSPFLKKGESLNEKKIQDYIQMGKNKTVNLPLKSVLR